MLMDEGNKDEGEKQFSQNSNLNIVLWLSLNFTIQFYKHYNDNADKIEERNPITKFSNFKFKFTTVYLLLFNTTNIP